MEHDVADTQRTAFWLSRLTLSEFRSYTILRLDVGPEPVVLTGANGAGKTNLLEAISMLSPGRGLRRAAFDLLPRSGGSGHWAVAVETHGPDGAVDLGTGIDPVSGQRVARVNHTASTISDLAIYARMLWLTPALDGLFTGPASDRRRFLDRFVAVLEPPHAAHLAAFEKLTRQRNKLLENRYADTRWLSALEADIASEGTAVAAARRRAIDILAAASGAERQGGASAFPHAEITLTGSLEAALADTPLSRVEAAYADRLSSARPGDAAAGRMQEGPHRSDIAVRHGIKQVSAQLCSTGEQKALLIGLILAQARAVAETCGGFVPLLLLDEIAAHLDDVRRGALFDEIVNLGCQAWMTGTDRALFASIEGRSQCFDVGTGRLVGWGV
ncbi:MAG: DNA replication/repair protein RecF [Pseudomonadota bacterium]